MVSSNLTRIKCEETIINICKLLNIICLMMTPAQHIVNEHVGVLKIVSSNLTRIKCEETMV